MIAEDGGDGVDGSDQPIGHADQTRVDHWPVSELGLKRAERGDGARWFERSERQGQLAHRRAERCRESIESPGGHFAGLVAVASRRNERVQREPGMGEPPGRSDHDTSDVRFMTWDSWPMYGKPETASLAAMRPSPSGMRNRSSYQRPALSHRGIVTMGS